MDSFAVATSKGLTMRRFDYRYTFTLAAVFGAFHILMPVLGYNLGARFGERIASVDHWIAFGLLTAVGIRMLIDASREVDEKRAFTAGLHELVILAVATSIDAAAVGITFGLEDTSIFIAAPMIGAGSFIFSILGVRLGFRFGAGCKCMPEYLGGIVLVFMGARALLGGLDIVTFL